MGRKRTSGLFLRGEIWHIDKQVGGCRLRESTGARRLAEAEDYLAARLGELRNPPLAANIEAATAAPKTFYEAATKYLNEGMKRSLERDARDLRAVVPYVGQLPLSLVHMGTLQTFVDARRVAGNRSGTVNRTLAVVRRVLNLAARLWRDEAGQPWLQTAPMIVMQDWGDRRKPYPLSWVEQRLLFEILPPHLQRMALFKVNTGTREQEVCGLRWEWEERVPALGTSVFVIPGDHVKNREDRVVVMNAVARSITDGQRDQHPTWVFPYRGNRVGKINNSAWKRARRNAAESYDTRVGVLCPAGFRSVRVHDLKHTFGRRLRAAGVTLETRKVLLGHKAGDITTHYSAAELKELIDAVELLGEPSDAPQLVVLQGGARW